MTLDVMDRMYKGRLHRSLGDAKKKKLGEILGTNGRAQ